LIYCERQNLRTQFASPLENEGMFISAITVSELYLGVFRADTEDRRQKRTAFVSRVIGDSTVLDFNLAIAHRHAEIGAGLRQAGRIIGPHDLIIAATAVYYGLPLLTCNVDELSRVPGLNVSHFVS
jgi:predicted nucleic acid-binding protein